MCGLCACVDFLQQLVASRVSFEDEVGVSEEELSDA